MLGRSIALRPIVSRSSSVNLPTPESNANPDPYSPIASSAHIKYVEVLWGARLTAAEAVEHELMLFMRMRVAAGQALYFVGPLSGPKFEAHVLAVDQLRRETGRSVIVSYGPELDD